MRYFILLAALVLLIPYAAGAGDCGGKCKSKCNACKPACACKSECAPKCDACKPKCELCAPKCSSCEQSSCTKPCSSCGKCGGTPSCGESCAKPCACSEWNTYCGCGMLTSVCINLEASCCDGAAGPVYLVLRDKRMNTLASIELAGPLEGYYQISYDFETPLDATAPVEALLLNDSEDTLTLQWLKVTGLLECGSFTYFDHACPGVVIGQGGCPRMVLY
jgi:hypothetical protein